MKKILTVLAVIALTATVVANAAESRLENYVNKKLSPITQKEKDFNAKMEAQQKASEARQAEYKKQHRQDVRLPRMQFRLKKIIGNL